MAHNKKANETSKRDQIPLTKSSQHEQLTQKLTRSLAFSIGVKINGPIEARSLEVTVSKYRMIKTSVSQPDVVQAQRLDIQFAFKIEMTRHLAIKHMYLVSPSLGGGSALTKTTRRSKNGHLIKHN